MNRSEFLRFAGLLGLALPFQHLNAFDMKNTSFKGKVLIIGAGPAGMTAGHLLKQKGIDFQILEAAPIHGGRIKQNKDFVDFPIPLGAEWIHVQKRIFNQIVNDSTVNINIETSSYPRDTKAAVLKKGKLRVSELGRLDDLKFVNSSWLDFFNEYIYPSIAENILFEKQIKLIRYDQDIVEARDQNGDTYKADKIIVTVPVKQLQKRSLTFIPSLPVEKVEAIDGVTIWEGIKFFIEFKEVFYPELLDYHIKPKTAGQKYYYNAAYGQNSKSHVLGLLALGTAATEIIAIEESERINFILWELDKLFNNQATPNYIKHISQNWVDEPFINAAYIMDNENWKRVRMLGKSVNNKLFFAGDGYTQGEDWSSVHMAGRADISAVEGILEMRRSIHDS